MTTIQRELEIYVDNEIQIAQGCHIFLYAEDRLSLRPALHRLEIVDLSDSSAALLAGAKYLEVRREISMLAMGEIMEVFTGSVSGKRITSVIFSPGFSLWQSSVSLTIAAGVSTSDAIRALLSASGTNIPLAAFTATDLSLSRPQSFFGRTCDAISLLAKSAGGDAFIGTAGLCIVSGKRGLATYAIPETDLLAKSVLAGDHLILSTSIIGWTVGVTIETIWEGITLRGRVVSSLLQADTLTGPWKSELELEV